MATPTSTPITTAASAAANSPRAPSLRSALKDDSDRSPMLSGQNKAVQIAEPKMESPLEDPANRKQFTAGVGRRLSARMGNSSRTSLISQASLEGLSALTGSPSQAPDDASQQRHHHHHRIDRISERLLTQVAEWIQHEKAKRDNRKSKKTSHQHRRKSRSPPKDEAESPVLEIKHQRAPSLDSDSSEASLDRLQRIIDDSMAALGLDKVPELGSRLRRRNSNKKHRSSLQLHKTASSDTDYVEGDVLVPSCDAVLDNSKTMSYSGGKAAASDTMSISSRREEKEKQAWAGFKNEIIRLAHTLKLKGWRRVPLDGGEGIAVERLSGALTNAVYVVSPPEELTKTPSQGKRRPDKLLLRVYGPQVDHLIDRENELSVLRRLARKRIGPRLLGTFTNGRFEEFFNATTLTPANLREPETSKQIAKRMRELHDGIELLEEELNEGPGVWKNWDRWLNTVEQTITFLDTKILSGSAGPIRGTADAWKARGLVCGVEWQQFKAAVNKYREFLLKYYGDEKTLRDNLVFAHNDTQYGNILRVRPDDRSPLLEPANEHKQLIVIDFEYAAANVPGLEFANHFTEWMYNYHDTLAPYACNASMYPTPDQQRRFIKAYVDHRPQFPHAGTPKVLPHSGPTTPKLHTATSSSSIAEFMLDARVPPGGWKEEEKKREEQSERQVDRLMEETRLWRIANSAQWVAWGIIQAKVPGFKPAGDGGPSLGESPEEQVLSNGAAPEEADDGSDEFDYLGYAQERALFFWGDCLTAGLITKEELPEDLRQRVKIVPY